MSNRFAKLASTSLIVGLVFGSIGMAPQAVAAPKSTSVSVSTGSAVSVSTKPATKKIVKKKQTKAQIAKAKKIKANNKKRATIYKQASIGANKRVQYKWGGSTHRGWDCSGLVSYAHKKAGVWPPGGRWNTRSLKKDKRFVRTYSPKLGDVVYQGNGHMGIYAGKKGKKRYIIDAANTKSDTRKTTLYQKWDKRAVSYYTLRN